MAGASDLRAAAVGCVEAEDVLSSVIAGYAGEPAAGHHELSAKIKEEALRRLVTCSPDPSTTVLPAACLMCVAEEARLLSETFRKWTTFTGVNDDQRLAAWAAEQLQQSFEFGHEVRKVVLDILTTYRGPYSKQISAALLGMKREATLGRELLYQEDAADHEERLIVSDEIREFMLPLLKIIRNRFPRESAIDYRPIEPARSIIRKKHAERRLSSKPRKS